MIAQSRAGPTNFSPVISAAALFDVTCRDVSDVDEDCDRTAAAKRATGLCVHAYVVVEAHTMLTLPVCCRPRYTVLLIVTDGEITDMDETIDAIVEVVNHIWHVLVPTRVYFRPVHCRCPSSLSVSAQMPSQVTLCTSAFVIVASLREQP